MSPVADAGGWVGVALRAPDPIVGAIDAHCRWVERLTRAFIAERSVRKATERELTEMRRQRDDERRRRTNAEEYLRMVLFGSTDPGPSGPRPRTHPGAGEETGGGASRPAVSLQ